MVPEKQQNGNALINRYLSIRVVKLFKLKKPKNPQHHLSSKLISL